MNLVLDTNVLISGILWRGKPNEVLKLIETFEEYNLVQCSETFNEFEEVIQRGKFAEIIKKRNINIDMVLSAVFTGCKFYHISGKTKEIVKELEIEDEDDLKFVELAVEAEADFIVSGDSHLLNLKNYQDIKILNPAKFLKIISNREYE